MRVAVSLYAQCHAAILDHDASVQKAYGPRCLASELQVTRGPVWIVRPIAMVYRIQSFYLFARGFHVFLAFLVSGRGDYRRALGFTWDATNA